MGISKFGAQDESDCDDNNALESFLRLIHHSTQSDLLHGSSSHLKGMGVGMDGVI